MEEVADRLVAEGWDPDEARIEARRRFGDTARYRAEMLSETDDEGRWMMETMASLAQDVRLAFRGLRKRPMFAWTLVLTLAVGIGAAGAIFSMVDAVLLRPLPYADPGRLVKVGLHLEERNFTIPSLQADQIESWTAEADFFSEIGLHETLSLVRTDGPEPEQLAILVASPELDEVLGMTVGAGRSFGSDDARPGGRVALMSYPYWRRTGSDPDAVGSTLRIDDETWTVVGILPRGFKFPIAGRADLWIPLATDGTAAGRTLSQISVVGRLVDDITLASAQERADALGLALDDSQPHEIGWSTRLDPLGDWRANPVTARGLWTAFGAVVGMLLIAILNATNLQLVRAEERQAEVGVRKALGASRSRVVRSVVVESVVLALLAGVCATGLAWAAVEGLRAIAPEELTFGMVHDFGLEGRALTTVFLAALGAGLLVALFPALQSARSRFGGDAVGRRLTDRRTRRLRDLLVAGEIALSVVLLVGAGLFLRSFAAVNQVDLGVDVERIAAVTVSLPSSRYGTGADRAEFARQVLLRLEGLAGAQSVALAQGLPPQGGGLSFNLELQAEGEDPRPTDELVMFNVVRPGYLDVLGTELVDGRGLREGDRDLNGVLIDRDLARMVFGSEAVAGRRFRFDPDDDWMTVMGVIQDIKLSGPDDQYGAAAILYPMDAAAPPAFLTFAVRTAGDPGRLLPTMRAAVLEVDARLPLQALQTGEEALSEALVRPRFLTLLISVLAGISLLLATVGLFGVVSYTVARGRREMGIRMALGASGGRVRAGVLRWGLVVATLGVVFGLAAAAFVDDLAESLLFGVAPGDLVTNLAVAVTMMTAALLACWWPAVRATKVDPVEVLRAE